MSTSFSRILFVSLSLIIPSTIFKNLLVILSTTLYIFVGFHFVPWAHLWDFPLVILSITKLTLLDIIKWWILHVPYLAWRKSWKWHVIAYHLSKANAFMYFANHNCLILDQENLFCSCVCNVENLFNVTHHNKNKLWFILEITLHTTS